MIKTTILGNLGKDAEIKHFGEDKLSVLNFSVAHTENRKNKDGVKEQTTIWISAAWWLKKDVAEKVAPYLKKGKKVYLEGEPGARAYIPSGSSEPKAELTLRVFSLEFAESAQATGTAQASTPPVADKPQQAGYLVGDKPPEEDDLPF